MSGHLFLVAVGNPFDGITLYSFASAQARDAWTESREGRNNTWWFPEVIDMG